MEREENHTAGIFWTSNSFLDWNSPVMPKLEFEPYHYYGGEPDTKWDHNHLKVGETYEFTLKLLTFNHSELDAWKTTVSVIDVSKSPKILLKVSLPVLCWEA